MRALVRLGILCLAIVVLPGRGLQAARADDAPQDESAASKAFRDAWWAETGGGNLTQALDLYAKAADAEGPASVRARALYRRAVVLQRIGKTEDAIRALERLAKDFAGESDLQAQARARLTEWTAVDLRSSFSEWFQRYQYSPEFQAKIIDLVLKLGAQTVEGREAAQRELLTIGAAAIPALREHTASKNGALADESVGTLLLLGEVPDQVVDSSGGRWMADSEAWRTILSLPAERRAALAARVREGAVTLKAALGGTEGVLAWLATPSGGQDDVRATVLRGLLWTLPKESPPVDRLAALVLVPGQGTNVRGLITWWLRNNGRATAEHVRAWVAHEAKEVRQAGWWLVGEGRLLPATESWALLLDRFAQKANDEQNNAGTAFLAVLQTVPWPQELDRAADALANVGGSLSTLPAPEQKARYVEVLARVIERTRSDDAGSNALRRWLELAGNDPGSLAQLRRWGSSAPTVAGRSRAGAEFLKRATVADLDLVVDLLTDPALSPQETEQLWQRTAAEKDLLTRIVESPAWLRRMLDRYASIPSLPVVTDAMTRSLLTPFQNKRASPKTLFDLWIAAPEKLPGDLNRFGSLTAALAESGMPSDWREAWIGAWPGWNDEQRTRAIGQAVVFFRQARDPQLGSFLRERLRAGAAEVPKAARTSLLLVLGKLTLEDLRAAYDLSNPDDVDQAVGWVAGNSAADRRLEATPEVFQALRGALRPDGRADPAAILAGAFADVPQVQHDLVAAILARNEPSLHQFAIQKILVPRASPDDEDLWLKALKDKNVETRVAAAKGMERVPTDGVKRALVSALDDPHPDVRAAALASLDNLQKVEDLKARWRDRIK